ncbi:MAG: polysaccharide deacetylase family protein [Solirubrobacterales bacterium]|nr:polysaccharide deacetylase family protein [Solirubrobacterales bacterium]
MNRAPDRTAIRRRRVIAALMIVGAALAIFAVVVSAGVQSNSRPSAQGRLPNNPGAESGAAKRTLARGSYRGSVPILMYHVIKAPAPGVAYPELWAPPATFRATIAALAQAGYRGVTMAQVWAAWHGGEGLPVKPIVISFDDGYLSHFVTARPILKQVGWPGVLNLEGKNIGPGGLTISQVNGLISDRWEIGAHSMTHPDLTAVSSTQLQREVAGSRALLERVFQVPVTTFCYPAGKNDASVRAAVKAAGYSNATTVAPGVAAPTDRRLVRLISVTAAPSGRFSRYSAPADVNHYSSHASRQRRSRQRRSSP